MVRERGIDFEPTDDDLQALRKAGGQDALITALHAAKPQPLTQDQMLHLVAGGLPSERVTVLVKQRGIDFLAEEDYLDTLRLAGADDTLIAAVREASAALTAELTVTTSPNAEVFLDGESQGHHKDVKNEGRPGYVLENTAEADKMAVNRTAFLAENAQIARNPAHFLSGNAWIAHKSTRTRTGQRVCCATRMGRQVGRSRKMPLPYLSAFRRSANLQSLS